MPAGMRALYQAAGKTWQQASTQDFGFALGPRINAAGRLADMTIGIECLLTDDVGQALELAAAAGPASTASASTWKATCASRPLPLAEALCQDSGSAPAAISVFDPEFHEGVVGIVASRIKDRLHRPTFVFAASQAEGKTHELKGSGRSIPGFHLRDALDLLAKRHPDVSLRFGGHAMAAGCTIAHGAFRALQQRLCPGGAGAARVPTCSPVACTPMAHCRPSFASSAVVEQLQFASLGPGL